MPRGWLSERRRLNRAARDALSVPTFRTPQDCAPWVLGGLWPAELDNVSPGLVPLVDRLKAECFQIVDAANYALRMISESQMPDAQRHDEMNRVVRAARRDAQQRVRMTVDYVRRLQRHPLAR